MRLASGASNAQGGEGVVVKYNLPYNATTVSQSWSTSYPGAAGPDQFNGIAATPTNAYASGYSFSRTADVFMASTVA